jgi:hypothetical protein
MLLCTLRSKRRDFSRRQRCELISFNNQREIGGKVAIYKKKAFSTLINTIISSEMQESTLPESQEATTPTSTGLNRHGVPTLRPRRDNCTPPAIEQFPPPLMSAWLRTVSENKFPSSMHNLIFFPSCSMAELLFMSW